MDQKSCLVDTLEQVARFDIAGPCTAGARPIRHNSMRANMLAGAWTMTETERELLGRITANPGIFSGKPTVRGMRIPVEVILSLLAQGETVENILDDYPGLESEDIRACLAYAHAIIANDSLDEVHVASL